MYVQSESDDSASPTPPLSSLDLFMRVVGGLTNKMPLAAARSGSRRYFLANGGSLSLESDHSGDPHQGLLECATPECSSPREVITHQAAMDALLSETIESVWPGKSVHLIKNSSDAVGHIYGQQENYEVDVAVGWRLGLWRLGLVLLLPLIVVYKVLACVWLGSLFLFSSFCRTARSMGVVPEFVFGEEGRYRTGLDHKKQVTDVRTEFTGKFLSPRLIKIGAYGLRCLHFPIAVGLHVLITCTAIIPLRRYLSAFLVSRIILDGSGHLDRSGRYWLGARATIITCLLGFGRYWGERPILVTGHWLEGICSDSLFSLRSWTRLFARRQRIQISLGDATPSEHVEYLRVGVTCLVLDLIEQGKLDELPRMQNPLQALVRFSNDSLLMRSAEDRDNKRWTAIEIQRAYARAVRDMLMTCQKPPDESWSILNYWQSILQQMDEGRHDSQSPHGLLGRIDWLSKKWLMDQLGSATSWSAKKKVDIRYHELSRLGYCRRFTEALKIEPLLDAAQVDRARRNPPPGTPAARRGYLIREFFDSDELRVDWDTVEFRVGCKRHVIRLRS